VTELINYISDNNPGSILSAVGFSMGANFLTKYVGMQGDQCKLYAAVSVSNLFNFLKSSRSWQGWQFHTFLGYHLTKFLLEAVEP
jgi:uncharacterized protein